jgi:hypothetical protein
LHKPIQKQESLWAFAIPQFGWVGSDVMEIWRTTMYYGPFTRSSSWASFFRVFTFSPASVLCMANSSITFYLRLSIM